MRILLINPPCDKRTIGLRNMAKLEPLGLETIAAGVVDRHEVRIVDMEVAPRDLDWTLLRFKPDIVGVTSEIVHRGTSIDVLRKVRKRYPECVTVVGGHHPTMDPDDFNDPLIDVIVMGEGLAAFREICDVVESGSRDFTKITGLALPRHEEKLLKTPHRPLPKHLDDYPMPARWLTKKYRDKYFYIWEQRVAAVRTSFGCPHHCTFCSVRLFAEDGFIARDPKLIFEEICALEEEFILFCDDHSFYEPERMITLANMLIEAGVKKRYFAYARADSIVMYRDVYELWAKAGLMIVMCGLEAVDDRALKRNGKQTSQDTNEQAVRIAEELGFYLSAGFLVEPHFGREDFDIIDRYAAARPSILITEYTALTPFPGTPLYKKEQHRVLTHDMALYDLQHFVLPTRLPSRELYDLMLEYHGRSVQRVIKHLLRTRPGVFLSSHAPRFYYGMMANSFAYKTAHKWIPDRRWDRPSIKVKRSLPLEKAAAGEAVND